MSQTKLASLLLDWYRLCGRDLPWRVKGGAYPDPYVILVSEFMLQQTTVKTVIPYFHRFMARFPAIQDLAAASLEDVYRHWQGLGYYSRARSLHATARMITEHGSFPQTMAEVLKLKGIGAYTAASYLALAFNQPETVVDGNVIRIICRLYRLTRPTAEIMDGIRRRAVLLTDRQNPADYASAIMDLGALICTPKKPQCLICPWQKHCLSTGHPDIEKIPLRAKTAKQEKYGNVCLIFNRAGQVYIRQRTEKGLLSGLWEFPWTDDNSVPWLQAIDSGKTVTHIFTHIKLSLKIHTLQTEIPPADGLFIMPEQLKDYPLSTLMKKVWAARASS